jgi:two-component system, chemotaxis family, sensor kinase CheA
VGMDVVRSNIEKISGTIEVNSQVGFGTTFKLKIPLTLAIIPTLIITSGGDRYAIPQVNLLELVRLEGEQAKRSIELFHGTPVYRLRERLLPLVYLNQVLQLDEDPSSSQPESDDEVINIIVLQTADKPFGLVVDFINDTQEIVVKPLGKQLKAISCFAGATIMGDGKVALILDVQGLAQRTLVGAETKEKSRMKEDSRKREPSEEPQRLLLFRGPDNRRMAIPLSLVYRLEEIPQKVIERVGNGDVVQYRNQIMPLIHLSDVFSKPLNGFRASSLTELPPDSPPEEPILLLVVVSIDGENQIGLVVEQILDIVEQAIDIKGASTQAGILYSAVVQDRVTEILDVAALIDSHFASSHKQLVGVS